MAWNVQILKGEFCPGDGCYENYVIKKRLQNHLKAGHLDFPYEENMIKTMDGSD